MSDELGKSLQYSVNQKFGSGTYQVLEPIKRGADGYVYKIQYIKQKRLAALKVLPRYKLSLYPLQTISSQTKKYNHDKNLQQKAQNQIKIHESLRSTYIVKLYNSSKDDMNYYMFLQYLPKGDLADQLSRHTTGLAIERVRKIGLQLAKGIDTIHRKLVVHRDVKPQNVLLGDDDQVKICDFSCARMVGERGQMVTGAVGTLEYMAPEILGKYGYSVDIWSYGCLLYAMATGRVPFKLQKSQISEYIHKINESSIRKFVKDLPKHLKGHPREPRKGKTPIKDLQCDCEGSEHEKCYRKLVNLLRKIFVFNVENRFKLQQIIRHPFFTGKDLQDDEDYQFVENNEQQARKIAPKTCYSLEYLKKGTTSQIPNKLGRTTEQILNKHKQKYMNIEVNNENVNTLNAGNKKQKGNLDHLMRYKLNDGIQNPNSGKIKSISTNGNKYISDTNPNAMKDESYPSMRSSVQPINLKGINFSQTIHSELVTINENGLRAESTNSDKTMLISPKGQHITLIYEGKSLFYELNRLPEKYMKHYKYYQDVVHRLRSLASSRDLKRRGEEGVEDEGARAYRTSREKESKEKRAERPNSTNKAQKTKQKPSQVPQCQLKSQIDFAITLNIPSPQSLTLSLFLSSPSKNIVKPFIIELSLSSSRDQSTNQKVTLSESSFESVREALMSLTVMVEFHGKPGGKRDRDQFKAVLEEKNGNALDKWAQTLMKYCQWFSTAPVTEQKPQRQPRKHSQESPRPQKNRYLAQKQKIYNIAKNPSTGPDQNKHYNHRILLDNYTSKYR